MSFLVNRLRLAYWRYIYGMELQRKYALEEIYLRESLEISHMIRVANNKLTELGSEP